MGDDAGISTKLDRLTPLEKMRDPKERMVPLENPGKWKKRKKESEKSFEDDLEKEKGAPGSSEEGQSGKIVDIVI